MRAGMIGLWLYMVAALAGCGNACESVCDEMAAFARDCGYTVTQNDIDECLAAQSSQDRDSRRICRDFGDRASIEQSWDCLEIGRYYPEQNIGDTPK